MYHHTEAFLDINGSLSPIIHMTSGVRQGCPLSALFFIFGIEPFLFHLQNNTFVQSTSPFKIVAYADDITWCLKIDSLQPLFFLFLILFGYKSVSEPSEDWNSMLWNTSNRISFGL